MANFRQDADEHGKSTLPVMIIRPQTGFADLLDEHGVPIQRPISEWLDLLDPAAPIDARSSRWLQAVLRFSRADGSPVFAPRGKSLARLRALESWAQRVGDPSLMAILSRWLPSGLPASAMPLPSDSRADQTLAMLRPDWDPRGDLVAIDHRRLGDETLIEVASRGRAWIGPSWTSSEAVARPTRSTPTHWTSNVFADGLEWAYKLGASQVTRSATLLRGRSMALLGQQTEGRGRSTEVRLDLGMGVEASLIDGSRAVLLSTGRGQPTARLIPLGLPGHDRPTDLGSITVEGRQVVIRQVEKGRRGWLPVLVCWGKAPTTWRPLTVAERSKTCGGDVAVAYRVVWGTRDEAFVVYRSLAKPALRSFLGHQTSARFLVGAFTRSGEVRPILKVEG